LEEIGQHAAEILQVDPGRALLRKRTGTVADVPYWGTSNADGSVTLDDGWTRWTTPDGDTFWGQRHHRQRAGPPPD
jgi:hypothetical protein